MKKYFYSLFAAASMMLAVTSCSQEEELEQISSGHTTTFSVNLDGVVGSRAVGEGVSATKLYYEVHRIYSDGTTGIVEDETVDLTQTKNVPITLLNGEKYNIIFWAQAPTGSIYDVTDLTNITVSYKDNATLLANQETYDAFYNALAGFKADGKTHTVTLRRPFAQLNLGANDWETAKTALDNQDPVTTTSVKVKRLASTFNALTGNAGGEIAEPITFALNTIPEGNFKVSPAVNATDYKYLSANYLLIPGVKAPNGLGDYVAETECKATVDLEFVLKRGDNEILNLEVPNAPVQRNWRTNVIGALLTGGNSFDIVIDSTTDNDENINTPVVGLSALNEALKAYKEEAPVIYNVTGLSTLSKAEIVIPTGFKAAKVTFNLKDIEGGELIVKDENSSTPYNKTVAISIPDDTDLEKHEITLIGGHVELLGGHYGNGIVSTSSSTLVLLDGATIGDLTVNSGNVEIQTGSAVGSIEAGSGNTVIVALGEGVNEPAKGNNVVMTDIISEGVSDDGNGVYYISNAEGLKWIAATTNEGKTYEGKTIKLIADIDLNNEKWTPIGNEKNNFKGVFDGGNCTIKNLSIIETEAKEGKAYTGFFGYAKDATIKNVTFENVNINIPCLDIDHSQGHIGAVAGSLEGTSTIEDVTVKGDIKVYATQDANGASRVAVVAGGNSYGNVTMKNVHVIANEGSYLKANNNVGALAGQLQGKSVFENCSSNIDVTGTKFFAGGIIGLAAGDQLFTNCQTTGDVTITAGREGRAHDHYRVGGIAGGWSDGAKNVLTITNCSYTGKISGKNADGSVAEAFDYAGYVGRGYTLNGCQGSKVVIDGVEYVQAYNTAAEAGIYYVDGDLTVYSAANLKFIADKVNSGAEDIKGKTIKLGADIDLKNEEWTPIGNSEKKFQGTFDGQNHTISNLVITGNNSYVGLFGFTTNGEIKNLTVENAKVSGRLGVGVVAGSPYTSKYTNIKVKGHVEVNGFAYVGGVGGRNAYANWDGITVEVDATSYVKANSVENGTAYRTYVGGVCGFNGEGGHSFKNITSNIDVTGSTIDVGGLFGIAHYGNTFENCSSSGNVEITNATEAADAQEIGGIAGVWHNQDGTEVRFAKCSFSGTLKTNIEGVKFYYGGLIGKPYSASGTGELFINNKKVAPLESVSTADALVAALESGKGVVFTSDIKIDPAGMSNAYGTTGINVKNGQTIDGGGHTLDIKGAGGTWDSGINTTGGLIKNIKVTGSFRGIFINHNSNYSESVVLENVTIEGTTYTISCDQGMNQNFEAYNSTFKGWTSYAATIGTAMFTDCYFGEGNGYSYCRPYAPTAFVGCEFEDGFKVDPRAAVTFENCTLNGVAITADNLATLVIGDDIANATVK